MGTTIRLIKGDARSLDYGSLEVNKISEVAQ